MSDPLNPQYVPTPPDGYVDGFYLSFVPDSGAMELEVAADPVGIEVPQGEYLEVFQTGPQGPKGERGDNIVLVESGGVYPARPNALTPVIFVGLTNPDTLGLMLDGDTWYNPDYATQAPPGPGDGGSGGSGGSASETDLLFLAQPYAVPDWTTPVGYLSTTGPQQWQTTAPTLYVAMVPDATEPTNPLRPLSVRVVGGTWQDWLASDQGWVEAYDQGGLHYFEGYAYVADDDGSTVYSISYAGDTLEYADAFAYGTTSSGAPTYPAGGGAVAIAPGAADAVSRYLFSRVSWPDTVSVSGGLIDASSPIDLSGFTGVSHLAYDAVLAGDVTLVSAPPRPRGAPQVPGTFTVALGQPTDGTGPFTLSITDPNLVIPAALTPHLSTTPGAIDVLEFTWINSNIGSGGRWCLTGFTRADGPQVATENTETLMFSYAGQISVQTGILRYYADVAQQILSVRASLGSPGTGSPVILDANLNGTSIFTDQSTRPTLPDGAYTDSSVPQVADLAPGDFLTIDIDQVGSTTPGSFLTVQIRVRSL